MSSRRVNRVVVVVLDGLRPDAIAEFDLRHVARLCAEGAHTLAGQTVQPSVTNCAMASLYTGAPPEVHGMLSDAIAIPIPRGPVHPIPAVLERHGLPSAVHMARIPFAFRGIAKRIARMLGVEDAGMTGDNAAGILDGARGALLEHRRGFILTHWPDADRAGHKYGWMSPQYGDATRRLDEALGELIALLDLPNDPDTLLIAVADHGGGGAKRKDHNSSHPLDRTIPIIFAGGAVVAGPLSGPVSLLDIPATVLWALGIPRPESYVGNVITQAFVRVEQAAA